MFDFSNKPVACVSDSQQQKKEDISLPAALGIGGLVAYAIFHFKVVSVPGKLEKLQFEYFEYAAWAGYGLLIGVCAFLVYQLVKRSKSLVSRYNLLSPMMNEDWDSILVGKTDDKIDLHLSDDARTTHVQIIGSTGRGKTESVILPWASRDAKRGKSFVIIDGKGSPDLMERALQNTRWSCQHHKILRFDLNNFKGSGRLNPLASGTPQQIVDRLFSALTFEEPFYKSVQADICGTLVKLIHANGNEVNFKRLQSMLTDDSVLAEEIGKCPDQGIKTKATAILKQNKKERDKNVQGLLSQIAPFADGELSELVNGDPIRYWQDSIYLSDIIKHGGFSRSGDHERENRPFALVISIPTLKYQESGHILGKLILQDIAFAIGEREANQDNDFMSIFLDEFSEFVFPNFISTLNKARSANVAFHLSHQSMGDLDDVTEGFAKSVMTNTNVKCILGLNDPDSADYFARHFGTFTEEKKTEQVDGEIWGEAQKTGKMSVREVESFKISPNDLKSFTRGSGVLHLPSPKGNVSEIIQFKSFMVGDELKHVQEAL
ncbi:MAG: TraM recognition domain-containing protein [Bdellovibrionales bacterium]|nr:TraM recognition domain-containing protein [Bdellovibrionales bacterium]NQZ19582.1 TraM recognition domain-containing protein [Bdellovibrionales bacterium]